MTKQVAIKFAPSELVSALAITQYAKKELIELGEKTDSEVVAEWIRNADKLERTLAVAIDKLTQPAYEMTPPEA